MDWWRWPLSTILYVAVVCWLTFRAVLRNRRHARDLRWATVRYNALVDRHNMLVRDYNELRDQLDGLRSRHTRVRAWFLKGPVQQYLDRLCAGTPLKTYQWRDTKTCAELLVGDGHHMVPIDPALLFSEEGEWAVREAEQRFFSTYPDES